MKEGIKASGIAILILVLTAACGGRQTISSAASSSRITSVASEPRLSSADVTFSMLARFNCRLPVQLIEAGTTGVNPGSPVPGFLDLATGHFVSDPAARGIPAFTYSWPAKLWFPVDHQQVAPDGLHYAYAEKPAPGVDLKLHVVDVAAGTDRVISTGVDWGILEYGADGIYVTKAPYFMSEGNSGLWRMNPATGAVQQLLPETAANLVLGGAAVWGVDSAGWPTTLYRYDLASGARSTWMTRLPNSRVQYMETDSAGHPVVDVETSTQQPSASPARVIDTSEIWLLFGASQGTVLYSGPQFSPSLFALSDTHGVWLGGNGGLWIVRPGGLLTKVTSAQVQPLGDCN